MTAVVLIFHTYSCDSGILRFGYALDCGKGRQCWYTARVCGKPARQLRPISRGRDKGSRVQLRVAPRGLLRPKEIVHRHLVLYPPFFLFLRYCYSDRNTTRSHSNHTLFVQERKEEWWKGVGRLDRRLRPVLYVSAGTVAVSKCVLVTFASTSPHRRNWQFRGEERSIMKTLWA